MREKNRRRTTPQFLTSGAAASALTAAAFAFLACPAIPGITGGAPAEAATLTATFQNGAPAPFDGGDYNGAETTWINQDSPTAATSSTNTRLWVHTSSNDRGEISLIRWDVSSLAGKYSSIDKVQVILSVYTLSDEGDTSLHAVDVGNASWAPGSASDETTVGDSTWNSLHQYGYMDDTTQPPTEVGDTSQNVAWIGGAGLGLTSGQGGFGPALATVDVTSANGYSNGSHVEFTLSDPSIVDQWITSGVNPGLAAISSNGMIRYNAASTDDGPQLIVTYTPVPEPASLALLDVGGLLLLRRRRRGDV